MWVYKKNHAGITSASYEELSNYLALYINFKLKVVDAKAMNLDADTAYKKEISGYERTLKAQKKTDPKKIEYDFKQLTLQYSFFSQLTRISKTDIND